MLKKLSFYFYVFYCFEVGLFLMVVPWWMQNVWEQNFFLILVPPLRNFFLNPFFRGAVSGIGALNVFLAVSEIIGYEKSKHLAVPVPPPSTDVQDQRIDA